MRTKTIAPSAGHMQDLHNANILELAHSFSRAITAKELPLTLFPPRAVLTKSQTANTRLLFYIDVIASGDKDHILKQLQHRANTLLKCRLNLWD